MDLSDEKPLNEAIQKYHKAIEEEWTASQPSVDDTPEEISKKARALVIDNMPELLTKAATLALSAGSESVSLSAIKFLYGVIVPTGTRMAGEQDPIEKLINDLTKVDD